MRRLSKTKKGFTLLEIILVIAIIVILAGALSLGVSDILSNARKGNSSVSEAQESVTQGIKASEEKLASYGF